MAAIRGYLESFSNLRTCGRNGLHRYNNQDHSMWTAVLATLNLLDGTDTTSGRSTPRPSTTRRVPSRRASTISTSSADGQRAWTLAPDPPSHDVTAARISSTASWTIRTRIAIASAGPYLGMIGESARTSAASRATIPLGRTNASSDSTLLAANAPITIGTSSVVTGYARCASA